MSTENNTGQNPEETTDTGSTGQTPPPQPDAPQAEPAKPETPAETGVKAIRTFLNGDMIKKRFEEILGTKAPGFIMSVLQVVNGNPELWEADIQSIYNAAATAAILDLPLNNNLQFAAIVPYRDKKRGGMKVAQFQMMWRGFVQLAQRSGHMKTIHVIDVREGELLHRDRLRDECIFNWIQDDNIRMKLPIVGFVSYFRLINGFEKMLFRTLDELQAHGKKYSKTYDRQDGMWNTDFNAMCAKTTVKELLNKWAPLSIEMATAIQADQAVMLGEGKYEYPDNATDEVPYEDMTEGKEKGKQAMENVEQQLKNAKGNKGGKK